MSKIKRSARHFESACRIYRLEDDWCTPAEYLPLIYHVLDYIDLDPGSTEHANKEFLQAEKIFTKHDDALNQQEPWKGNVYCFPPTYGRCSFSKARQTWRWSLRGGGPGSSSPARAWFDRLERDWKLGYVNSALFFTTTTEIMRTIPSLWSYPICIPSKRPSLVHGRNFYLYENFPKWGFFVFFPPRELGFNHTQKFQEAFSTIGNLVM